MNLNFTYNYNKSYAKKTEKNVTFVFFSTFSSFIDNTHFKRNKNIKISSVSYVEYVFKISF